MSENLAKIAQKIDFSKTNGEEVKKEPLEGNEKSEEDAKDSASFQSSLWPWDSVRNKLRFVVIFPRVWNDLMYIANGTNTYELEA